mmetsp:Transcript_42340/g.70136  ORF Transcript_42340/g.70136 Transcript_42340/m.70136 type:complete len:381 (+) Transcript_42340:152-1294(+)
MASSGSDAPAASPKAKAAHRKPVCRYGKACYNKNPAHLLEYAHPWLDAKKDDEKTDERKVCKYGKSCYNKTPEHLAQYAHPWLDEEEAPRSDRGASRSPGRRPSGGRKSSGHYLIKRLSTPPRENEVGNAGPTSPPARDRSRSPPPSQSGKAAAPAEEERASSEAVEPAASKAESDSEALPGALSSPKPARPSFSKKLKCRYGKDCHRKDPEHFDLFDHGEDEAASSPHPTALTTSSVSPEPSAAKESEREAKADVHLDAPVLPGVTPSSSSMERKAEDLNSFSAALDDLEAQSTVKQVESAPAAAKADSAPAAEPARWVAPREGAGSYQRGYLPSSVHRAAAVLRPHKSLPRTTLQVSVLTIWTVNFLLGCAVLWQIHA